MQVTCRALTFPNLLKATDTHHFGKGSWPKQSPFDCDTSYRNLLTDKCKTHEYSWTNDKLNILTIIISPPIKSASKYHYTQAIDRQIETNDSWLALSLSEYFPKKVNELKAQHSKG